MLLSLRQIVTTLTCILVFIPQFGFCIPNSKNTWDAVYDIPLLEVGKSTAIRVNHNLINDNEFNISTGWPHPRNDR